VHRSSNLRPKKLNADRGFSPWALTGSNLPPTSSLKGNVKPPCGVIFRGNSALLLIALVALCALIRVRLKVSADKPRTGNAASAHSFGSLRDGSIFQLWHSGVADPDAMSGEH
jgi:hypothetical protein